MSVRPLPAWCMERLAVAGTHIDMMAPLYRIANLDELWLEIAIPQERMGSIKIGDQVVIENSEDHAQKSPCWGKALTRKTRLFWRERW